MSEELGSNAWSRGRRGWSTVGLAFMYGAHHKKVVDDHRQIPVPGLPGPGPVSPGVSPFLLAAPHHAAAAELTAALHARASLNG